VPFSRTVATRPACCTTSACRRRACASFIQAATRIASRRKRLAGELGVSDCVRFLGRIEANDLPGLYAACDVFAMPARLRDSDNDVEGFGIVYVEASACERAVVGGRSGGVEDAILDGKTGLLVDPLSVEEIAAAIERLYRDPELRARLGTAGRRRAMSELTWRHFAARVCAAAHEATREK